MKSKLKTREEDTVIIENWKYKNTLYKHWSVETIGKPLVVLNVEEMRKNVMCKEPMKIIDV